MKLIISSVSGEPIYEQIKNQIRSAIMSGELMAGEALPSLRKLAKELRVSVLTVTRAYNELADEGLVENTYPLAPLTQLLVDSAPKIIIICFVPRTTSPTHSTLTRRT